MRGPRRDAGTPDAPERRPVCSSDAVGAQRSASTKRGHTRVARSAGGRRPMSPRTTFSAAHQLRDRSRAATRNNGYATGVIDELVRNVIGWGIRPLCKLPDPVQEAAAGRVQPVERRLCAHRGAVVLRPAGARSAWLVRIGGMLRTVAAASAADGFSVPLQVELLEPDLCPVTYNVAAPSGNRVRAGIEFDAIGRRVAYWILPVQAGSAGRRGPVRN
jgi:capsid protein